MARDTLDRLSAEPRLGAPAVPTPSTKQATQGVPEFPYLPLARPIAIPVESSEGLTPTEAAEQLLGEPIPFPDLGAEPRTRLWPPFPRVQLATGAYRITYQPYAGFVTFKGTLRVDRVGTMTTISGDLYRFLSLPPLLPQPPLSPVPAKPPIPEGERLEDGRGPADALSPFIPRLPLAIPIYPRDRYYSYLHITGARYLLEPARDPAMPFPTVRCVLTVQEYVYTQPTAGSFDGSFPTTPTRHVSIVLRLDPNPHGFFTGPNYVGTVYEAGVPEGSCTINWTSQSFRRATLEIDTVSGAVPPQPVPATWGLGTEDYRSAFAGAGWDVDVTYDQTNVPVPPNVSPTGCWPNAALHDLMRQIRKPTTDLDAEWRMHLLVVPATMGCGRGVMYDLVDVPREGAAVFADDGYPSGESAYFGTAANQKARDVPRAYLRTAIHEIGHVVNQIHQEVEAGADNSLMTTTPSVADVLAGPTTGVAGVFPDNISLQFNTHVRHHLVHLPDIVVRPGGMTFGSGHGLRFVPEADRQYFAVDQLELRIEPAHRQIELGEPLPLVWKVVNRADQSIPVPTDIGVEAQHTSISVTTPQGIRKPMPSFVIKTDDVTIAALQPGQALEAGTRLYWSSRGFAFETAGKYRLDMEIVWTYRGIPYGVRATTEIWVNYPQSTADNEAAALLLDPAVGMYVALGGGALHLTDAVARIEQVHRMRDRTDQPAPRALRGYEDLLPATTAAVDRRAGTHDGPRTAHPSKGSTRRHE